MYAVDFSVQSSVISYKRRWIQRESILILVESVLIGHDNAKEVNREKEK